MFLWMFIFLGVAIISFLCSSVFAAPTTKYISKLFFYVSLLLFITLFISITLNAISPQPHGAKKAGKLQ